MKKERNRGNIGLVVCILTIVIAAAALMAAVLLYYKQQQGMNLSMEEEWEEQSTQNAELIIPDITNPPETQKVTLANQEETKDTSDATENAENNTITEEEATADTEENDSSEFPKESREEEINGISDENQEEETGDSSGGTNEESIESSGTSAEENETQANPADFASLRTKIKEDTIANIGSHVVDLTALTEISGQEVRAMIESYVVLDLPYLDNQERVDGDFSAVLERRNLGGIGESVTPQYGVLTENTAIRSFPTWQKLSDATNWEAFDYLQETMLMAGEGVVIWHQSEDGIWSFVQGESYYGWTETSAIAFCSKESMVNFIESERFAVITVPAVTVEGINLRMGTRLPITGEEDGAYIIVIPKKDEENHLVWFEIGVDKEYLSDGYLEWSEDAVVAQAKKLLGTNYGWGDSNEYMDCTSTIRSVYNCFGVTLPRNSAWMPYSGLMVTDLQGFSVEEKREHIMNLPKGSILLINGHAMMYIGEEEGVLSMLHNVTQYRPSAEEDIVRPMKCVITPIDICNTAGRNYQELYLYSIHLDING